MDGSLIKNCLKGAIFSVCLSAMLLFLFAFICLKQNDPKALTGILGPAILAVGSLTGGFVAARSNKRSGLVCGLVCGFMFAFLLVGVSLGMGGLSGNVGGSWWALLLAVPAISAVGGFMGRPRQKIKRRRR